MISPKNGSKKRLLSGVKPTGRPHIGNYFGAMKQFVDLQGEYESFVFIADLHALNFIQDKEEMQKLTKDLILDYLGIGLDPKHCTIFKQSAVTAHTSLTWIFDTLVTVPFMMRAHAYKDALAKGVEPSMGLFNYPVLMASDILIYEPDVVPVGKDQKQHIEYARDIAGKFNNQYTELFKLPNGLILEDVETVPGTDGQKMSKSYGNTIPLFGTDEEIQKAVMSIATDSRGKDEEKNPDDMVLYQIHKLFNSGAELKAQYKQGLGYGDAKKLLIKDIIDFVTPMRERRKKYEDDPKLVEEILLQGAIKANEVAMNKLQAVYEAVGLTS
jgi:tryptophanyl-tRNA synthetase